MQLLIAIPTCEARREYADAQRATWIKGSQFPVRFFLARQLRNPLPDEVFLDCGDGYEDLCAKMQLVNRWTLAGGYDVMLKADDDVLVLPERLYHPGGAYCGWVPTEGWCTGMTYWLTRRSMEVVANAPLPATSAEQPAPEDRWTGQILKEAGIVARKTHPGKIQWVGKRKYFNRAPLPANLRNVLSIAYAAGEFEPHEFRQALEMVRR